MAFCKYKIIQNSGELGLDLDTGELIIGDRIFPYLNSQDPAKVVSAKKRFTHEWWHVVFANLTKEKQRELLVDFRENALKDPKMQTAVRFLCEKLYSEEAYDFHKINSENKDIFVDSGFGIKVKETITIDGDEVYGAFLLSEILSLSSESETPDIEGYYNAVEPNDSYQHGLWQNKKELGRLSREIVSSMQSFLIEDEFKEQTQKGIHLLSEINREYLLEKEGLQSEVNVIQEDIIK